jgi:uncharacterized membrane protein
METMKRLVLLLGTLAALAAAKSYHYPAIDIDVILRSDGIAVIRQERTYAFDGSFSWAYLDLLRAGADSIRVLRLAELTADGPQDIVPDECSDRASSVYLKWSYSAQDEQKTFLVEYAVFGALHKHEDVAEFYWKVVENEHEPIDRLTVRIIPPVPSPDLFKVYVHSAARPGRLEFAPDFSRATVEQSRIPRNRWVEVRVLLDPAVFPLRGATGERRYERILAEERANFTRSTLRTYFELPLGVVLLVVVPLVLLLVFYRRYGREPRVAYEAVYEHEPPRAAPPLYVPTIMHQQLLRGSGQSEFFAGLFATLLDLARRGFVTVEETRRHGKSKYVFRRVKPLPAGAADPDRTAIDFFFDTVARGGDEFTQADVQDWGKSHSTAAKSFLDGISDKAAAWWPRELGSSLLDKVSPRAYTRYTLIVLGIILAGALVLADGLRTIATDAPFLVLAAIAAVPPAVVFLLAGRAILRWSEPGLLEHKRWQAFRKFLREFSAIKQAPVGLLAIWEQYYVYAVVLGVAEQFARNIGRLADARGTVLAAPIWYVQTGGTAGAAALGTSLASFSSFAQNFSGMVSSFTTSTRSGGGFSGGGGGGGGGGGSGAG